MCVFYVDFLFIFEKIASLSKTNPSYLDREVSNLQVFKQETDVIKLLLEGKR